VKTVSVRHPSKVWMNVTTSANWDRPAVGVVRVEQELCRALAELYDDAFSLCIFSDGEFRPFDGLKAIRTARLAALPTISTPKADFPGSQSFDPVLGRKKKFWRTAPASETSGQAPPQGNISDMSFGDVIVSVGLDWNYPYSDAFHRLRTSKGIQIVTFCHDVIPVVRPQYCVDDVASRFKDYFSNLSWGSDLILCNSQRSRDDYLDVVQRIGAPKAETLVIPLGDNVPKSREMGNAAYGEVSTRVAQAVAEPFILFVSTIDRRKNHEVLYRAYHLLAQEGHAPRLPKLLFVGMTGWGVGDLLKDIELDPLTKGLIVQLNHVTDDELALLYEKAEFCVYPSLYEGWGLPVGEALAYGKAVIASGEGSIPEVGGDLVTYLDPWNPRAWADEILKLVDQPERVQAMAEAVRKGYRVRTWHDTAQVVKVAVDKLREPREIAVTLYPGYDLYSMVGTPCAQAICSTGAAGSLTHGPYRTLPAGTYEIAIALDKLEGASGTVRCAMRSAQARAEHGMIEINFDEHEHFGLLATITDVQLGTQVDDYEICVEVTESLLVAVNKIEIRPA